MDKPDEHDLLQVATAISDGVAVDWAQLPDAAGAAVRPRLFCGKWRSWTASRSFIGRTSNPKRRPTCAAATRPRRIEHEVWGHFRLLEKIGKGTFGVVYRARDTKLDSEVALKLLNSAFELPTEARNLARVRHPNVVTVYGTDQIDGRIGIWMEFVNGRTLGSLLKSNGPYGAREAAGIGVDLCRALAAVHAAGLVHGDVKAHNVMRAAGGRTVLMDFGTGKDLGTEADGERIGRRRLRRHAAVRGARSLRRTAAHEALGDLQPRRPALPSRDRRLSGRRENASRARTRAPERRTQIPARRPSRSSGRLRLCGRAGAFRRTRRSGMRPSAPSRQRWRISVTRGRRRSPCRGPNRFCWWPRPSSVPRAWRVRRIGWETAMDHSASAPTAAATSTAERRPPSRPAHRRRRRIRYQIDTAFYRVRGTSEQRLRAGERVAPGDGLFVKLRVSIADLRLHRQRRRSGRVAICCSRCPGQAIANPVPAGDDNRIPGTNGTRSSTGR